MLAVSSKKANTALGLLLIESQLKLALQKDAMMTPPPKKGFFSLRGAQSRAQLEADNMLMQAFSKNVVAALSGDKDALKRFLDMNSGKHARGVINRYLNTLQESAEFKATFAKYDTGNLRAQIEELANGAELTIAKMPKKKDAPKPRKHFWNRG